NAQEEAALIGHIRALPLAPFQFGIYEGKRRVVFFGSRYDFMHQRLEAAEELPAWLVPLAGRVERLAALPSALHGVRCRRRHRLAPRKKALRSGIRALPRPGLQIPFPP